jgi:hypothetical protein
MQTVNIEGYISLNIDDDKENEVYYKVFKNKLNVLQISNEIAKEFFVFSKDDIINFFKSGSDGLYQIKFIQKNIETLFIQNLSLSQYQLLFAILIDWLGSDELVSKTKSVNKL